MRAQEIGLAHWGRDSDLPPVLSLLLFCTCGEYHPATLTQRDDGQIWFSA